MQFDFSGKSVLVTGSTKGIGRAIAESFLDEGAYVTFNARNAPEICNNTGNAISFSSDVQNPDQAQRLVDHVLTSFGKLDILVCNVGSGRSVAPGQESRDEWQRVFDLNLWSSTNMIEASKVALSASAGSIICISSICGLEYVRGAPLTYSAAKAALNSYIRGISRPLGKVGVRINGIAPGNIISDTSVWRKKLTENPSEVLDYLERNVALERFGTPNEIANLALWLASPLASFCTGSIFVADGGQIHA